MSTTPLTTTVSTCRPSSAENSSWTVRSVVCATTDAYSDLTWEAGRSVSVIESLALTYLYALTVGTTSTVGSSYSHTSWRDSGTYASLNSCGKPSG